MHGIDVQLLAKGVVFEAKERLEEIARRVAPGHEVLQKALKEAEVCFDWAIYRQPSLRSWISKKQRVVLLGDAAHATAPFMGQGANMAMHDAYCLGQLLRETHLPEALGRYEALRKRACEEVVAKSSFVGELHTASGWRAFLRNKLLSFVLLGQMRQKNSVDIKEKEVSGWQRLARGLQRICA